MVDVPPEVRRHEWVCRQRWADQRPRRVTHPQKHYHLCDEALTKLAAALEAGHSGALNAYLSTLGASTAIAGSMFCSSRCRDRTLNVAGFDTWRKMKRFMKKGEKRIAIFAQVVVKKRSEDEQEKAG